LANDVTKLQQTLQQTYADIFNSDAVAKMMAEIAPAPKQPMPVKTGDASFDPEQVKESQYFFC